jgi:hypothetical protein
MKEQNKKQNEENKNKNKMKEQNKKQNEENKNKYIIV